MAVTSAIRRGFHLHAWCIWDKQEHTLKLLLICAVLYNVGISLLFFVYGLFLLGMGWREEAIGITSSALILGGVAGVTPMARLARMYGFRVVLSGSLFASALTLVARTLLLGYHAQLSLSFIAGICLSGWVVCVSPVLANTVKEPRRAAAFSLLFAFAVAAGGLGGILGGYLPAVFERSGLTPLHSAAGITLTAATESKQLTLLFGCILLGLAGLPALLLSHGSIANERPQPIRRNVLLLQCVLASICWSLAVGLFNPFAALFFVSHLGVSMPHISLMFCVVQFAQAIALVAANGRLQRKFGLVPTIVSLQLITGAMLLLLAHGRVPAQAAVLYGCFMVLQRLCDPLLQCALMTVTPPAERSMATALFYAAWSISQALSASLGGSALQHLGYPPVLIIAGLCAIGAAASTAFLLKRLRSLTERSYEPMN